MASNPEPVKQSPPWRGWRGKQPCPAISVAPCWAHFSFISESPRAYALGSTLYASEGRRSHSPPRPHHQGCKLTHRGRVGSENVIPHLHILQVGEGT